jgi:gas vesicle protein
MQWVTISKITDKLKEKVKDVKDKLVETKDKVTDTTKDTRKELD